MEWKKKHKMLKPGEKYTMRQEGATAQLVIHDLEVKDAGEYTCVCGEEKTTAVLTVHGKENRNEKVLFDVSPVSPGSLSTDTLSVLSLILPSLILLGFYCDFYLILSRLYFH